MGYLILELKYGFDANLFFCRFEIIIPFYIKRQNVLYFTSITQHQSACKAAAFEGRRYATCGDSQHFALANSSLRVLSWFSGDWNVRSL